MPKPTPFDPPDVVSPSGAPESTPGGDEATPARDDHPNAAFGLSEAMGEGYPEEGPAATVPDGEPNQPWKGQPERDEG